MVHECEILLKYIALKKNVYVCTLVLLRGREQTGLSILDKEISIIFLC